MKISRSAQRSQLFTLRLWAAKNGDGCAEWRGQLRHASTGEVRYFRDWPRLVALIQALVPDVGNLVASTGPEASDESIGRISDDGGEIWHNDNR